MEVQRKRGEELWACAASVRSDERLLRNYDGSRIKGPQGLTISMFTVSERKAMSSTDQSMQDLSGLVRICPALLRTGMSWMEHHEQECFSRSVFSVLHRQCFWVGCTSDNSRVKSCNLQMLDCQRPFCAASIKYSQPMKSLSMLQQSFICCNPDARTMHFAGSSSY